MRVPSALRPKFQVVELEDRLTPAAAFAVPAADNNAVAVQLRYEWDASDSQNQNEFGIYKVDDAAGRVDGLLPSDVGYEGHALARAQALLGHGSGYGAKTDAYIETGSLLGVYLVSNGTTYGAKVHGQTVFFGFAAANADRIDHVLTVDRGDSIQYHFEDTLGGGDWDFNDTVVTISKTKAVPTPGTSGQTVQTTFSRIGREAAVSGEFGVYKVDSATGTVGGVAPGSAGYLQAVLGSAGRQTVFSTSDPDFISRTLTLDGGTRYGFYYIAGGSAADILRVNPGNVAGTGATAFFSFTDANPDGKEHYDRRGLDTFGLSDTVGGGNGLFRDNVIRYSFGTPQDKPKAPDTTAPVATFRLTNDTGASSTDLITSDPQGTLTVTDNSGTVTSLKAGFGSASVDILGNRLADGTVNVSTALITILNGGVPLPDGPQTLFVQAGDAAGNSKTYQFPFTLDTTPPVATYALTNDTGTSNTDKITSDPRGTLTVTDATTKVAALKAGFGAADIDILSRLGANGTVTVDTALLTQLNHGNTLADGAKTLLVQATDTAGNSQSFQFAFTLKTTGTIPTLGLATASDTGALGDLRTDNATVTLTGTADAGAVLQLSVPPVPGTPGSGTVLQTATADANGAYSFTGVALAVGPNSYTVREVSGTDAAGNAPAAAFSQTFVRNSPPSVTAAITNQSLHTTDPNATFDLTTVFTDAQRVARFNVAYPLGQTSTIDFQLFDAQAPQTVANFLAYVNSTTAAQNFNGSIFHRLAPGFVLQGGGFKYNPAGTNTATIFPTIPKFAPVNNEPGVSNTRGTLAMAKAGGNPNSATDEFFFNLADNSANLNNQNSGFTVFGQVMNGGQQTLDTLVSSLATFDDGLGANTALPGAPPFPIRPGANTTSFPTNLTAADLARITTASELTAVQKMTFGASSGNTNVATVSVTNGTLTLHPAGAGTTTITVTATDLDGSITTTTFQVTVS